MSFRILLVFMLAIAGFAAAAQVRRAVEGSGRWGMARGWGVQCALCPRSCYLPEGFSGECGGRMNAAGRITDIPATSH